ncbi:hypothetical protein [Amycolatopsis sp. NPDC051371]|uniref:hypothetical protein n=1 Tax=Amycolatopsis sp. NPDC051371 TaxID=3155800 RepID=UPI0034241B0E
MPMSGRRRHREVGGIVATLTAYYAETFGKAVDSRLKLRSWNGTGKMSASVSGPAGNRGGLAGVLEA